MAADRVDPGIAYDTTNNTLWMTNENDGTLYRFTLNGTLLSSIQLNQNNFCLALALDPADHTLWVWNGSNLEQYSRAGALLLFALGLAGLAFMRKKILRV